MRARIPSIVAGLIVSACICAGCDSCGSTVNNTVSFRVQQDQAAGDTVCHGHHGQAVGVARIDVLRTARSVDVRVVPLGSHRLECVSACVSTASDDPAACGSWVTASRTGDGSYRAAVPESEYDPQMCALEAYVHVRLRVTHDGSCDI